jgi:hypothetical protein
MDLLKFIPKYIIYIVTILSLFFLVDSYYISKKPFYFFGKQFGSVSVSTYLKKNNDSLHIGYLDRRNVSLDKCLSVAEDIFNLLKYDNIKITKNKISANNNEGVVKVHCPSEDYATQIGISAIEKDNFSVKRFYDKMKEIIYKNKKISKNKIFTKSNSRDSLALRNTNLKINTNSLKTCLDMIFNELESKGFSPKLNIKKREVSLSTNKVVFNSSCIANSDNTQTIYLSVSAHSNEKISYNTDTFWDSILEKTKKFNKTNEYKYFPSMMSSIFTTKITNVNKCFSIIKKSIKSIDSELKVVVNKKNGSVTATGNQFLIYLICNNAYTKNNYYRVFSTISSNDSAMINYIYTPIINKINQELEEEKLGVIIE